MNKKRLALLCALVLLMATMLPLAANASVYYAYVKTGNYGPLNLRGDTSTNSPIIGSIPYGKQVTVQDYYLNTTWVGVDYNGKFGYVMARYLVYDRPSDPPSGSGGTSSSSVYHMFDGFQYVSYYAAVRPSTPGGFVHMRWAPSKQMGIMTDFYDSHQLEVLAQNNNWAQVRDPDTGKTGFMMRSFLRDVSYGY